MQTETVRKAVREAVEACAAHAYDRHRGPYVSAKRVGRPLSEVQYVERILSAANGRSNERERNFYEALYVEHGGDPAQLPWSKDDVQEAQR